MASERPQRAAALKAKEGNCYTDQLELEDPYAVVGRPMGREEWRVTHWDGTSCLVNSGGPKQRRRHSSSSGRGQPRAVSGDSSKRRSPPAERCTAQSLGHAAGARQPGRQRGRGSAPLTGTAAAGAAAAAGRGDGRPAKRQRGAGQSPGDAAAAAARGAAAAAAAAAAAQADAEIEPLVAAEVGEESNGEDGSEDGTAGQPSAAAAAAAAAEEAEQDGDIEVIVISDSSDDEEARKAEWAAAEAAADAADAAEAAAAAAAERNAAGEGGGAETGQASEGASESLPPTEAYGGPGGGSGDEAEGPDGGSGDGSGGGSDEEEDEGSWEEGPALAARRRSGRGAARRMPAQGLEREDAEQPAAAAARRHGRPSGGKGKRGKAAAAEAAAAAAAEEEVEVAVEDQSDFWHLECLEEDTSQQGRLIAGWLRSNGPPGAKLWSKIRMVDEDSPGEEPQWLEYSAGDWVLTPYEDRVYDPERTEAVAQVVSFVELADGRVVVLLRWGDFYEDLVGRPPEHIPADEAMRGQNQVWLHTLNLRDPARLQEMLDEGNLAGDVIVRRCTVKHTHDILREYGGPHNSIEEYMEAEGPDAYWYSQQRPPCTLRLEDVPAPGRELQFKRIPVEQMTMIDAFAGAGFVTCGFELGGWKAVLGIELDSDAFAAYKANFPHAVPHGMWQQSLAQAVEAAKRGDPRYPKPGQVVHMHFSPPCQALSSVNSNRSVAQARAELWEHINAIVAAIKYWKPVSVSLEEVVQFLFTTMRAQPKHKGGSRSAAPAASTAADGSSDGGEDGEPSEAAEAAAAAVAREELRAWLMLQPHMIRMGYQCDWRLYAAGAYGAANTRFRVWGVFVRSGYELPPPPPPEYYVEESAMPVLGKDPRLANALGDGGNLRRLVVQPLDNLPYAPNLREAVYGVPLLPMDNPAQSFGTHTIDLREEDQQQPTSRLARWMRTAQLPRPGGDPDYRTCLHYHHREGARYQAKRAPSKPAAKQQKPLRMSWDRPLTTVCGKDDQNRAASWHPVQDRRLTVLEKKRGQAIPDQMALRGSIRQQYQQVGNAVPPPMAYAIAAALYRSLTGQEPPYKLPLLVGMEGQGRPETAREYVARQKVRGRAGERRQPAEGPAGGHGAVQQEQEQQQQEEEDEECHDEEAEGWGSGGRPGGSSSQASDGEEEEEEEEEEEGEAEAEQRRAQQRRQSGRQPQQQQQQQPQQQPQQQQQQQQPSPGRQLRLRDVVLRAPPAEPPADVILPAWPTAAEGVQQAEREEARAEEGGQQQQQLLQREQHPLAPQFEQREQQPSPPHVVPGESSGAGAAAMAAATAAGKMVAAAISSLNAAAQHAGAAAVAAAARKRAAGQPPADESPAKRQAGTGELHPVEQEQRGEQQGQAEQQPQQQQQQQQQQEQQAGLPAAEVKQEQVEQEQVEQQGQAQQAQQEAEVIDLISDEEEEEGGGAAAGAAGAAAADDAAGSEANVGAVGAAAAAAERAQQQPDDFFAVDIDSQGEAGSDAQPGSSGGGGGPRANAAAGSPAAAAPAAPAAAAAADDYGGAFSFPDDGVSPEQHGPLPAHQRFSPAQGGAAAQQWLLRTAGRLHF